MNKQHIHTSFSFMYIPGKPGIDARTDADGNVLIPAVPAVPDHWRLVGGIVVGLGVESERAEFDHLIIEDGDPDRLDRFIVQGREHERYTSAKEAMWSALKSEFKNACDKPAGQ